MRACVLIFARGVLYLLHGACKGKSLGAVPFLNLQRRFAKFYFLFFFIIWYKIEVFVFKTVFIINQNSAAHHLSGAYFMNQ